MKKVKRPTVTITDSECIRWLVGESKRRGDKTLARTATKVIAERRAQIDGATG